MSSWRLPRNGSEEEENVRRNEVTSVVRHYCDTCGSRATLRRIGHLFDGRRDWCQECTQKYLEFVRERYDHNATLEFQGFENGPQAGEL